MDAKKPSSLDTNRFKELLNTQGNLFKERRVELGLSQKEVAELARIHQSSLSQAERCNVADVKFITAIKLAKVLKIDMNLFDVLIDEVVPFDK